MCCPMRGPPPSSLESNRFGTSGSSSGFGSKREYFPPAVTTEESWVWDVEQNQPVVPRSPKPKYPGHHGDFEEDEGSDFPSRFHHYGHRHPGHNQLAPSSPWGPKKGKNFFAHFEDPRSHKNCPPSFSVEFDLPNSIEPEPPKIVNDIVLPPSPRYTPTTTAAPPPPTVAPEELTTAPVITEAPPVDITTMSASAMTELESQRDEKMKLINSDLCGISINTRIIGGDDAGINQFPWMARLAYRNRSKLPFN